MSTEATARLEEIYAPIYKDLGRLEEFLQARFHSEEPFLLQLLEHIQKYRGKQIRPALLLLVARHTARSVTDDHVKIAGVIEIIHTATLVHDDILDDAALRHNVETLHRRWGERAGILLGDYLYSRAFALSTEVAGMAQVLSVATNTICEGELLQIGSRFRPDLGEETYFEIIRKKTATLHAVACSLGGVLSGLRKTDVDRLHDFGMDLGVAFQIIDDCLDYSGQEAVVGKSLGTDLRQGKATLPLIYLLERLDPASAAELIEALRHPLGPAVEARIARQVRETGAVADSMDRARAFIDSARSRISGFDADLRESLDQVAEYVISRRH